MGGEGGMVRGVDEGGEGQGKGSEEGNGGCDGRIFADGG